MESGSVMRASSVHMYVGISLSLCRKILPWKQHKGTIVFCYCMQTQIGVRELTSRSTQYICNSRWVSLVGTARGSQENIPDIHRRQGT